MGNDPVRQRLEQLIGERNVSLSGLSRLLRRNPTYLQQFLRKGSPRRLEEQDRALLARFFGVPESELGAPLPVPGLGDSTGLVRVRRLDVDASAGPGGLAEGDTPVGEIAFDPAWLRQLGVVPERLSMIRVTGDSMEPTLSHGDDILVSEFAGGQGAGDGIHVIRIDGTLLVKRLAHGSGGRTTVLSDNSAYPPFALDPGHDVTVIGRVVWAGKRI